MKHDCENIEIMHSERNILNTIYKTVETYYTELGYDVFKREATNCNYFIGRCVCIKKEHNWLYDMIFNPKPTVKLYVHDHMSNSGARIITVEHRSKDMIATSKGLCKALNVAIQYDVRWCIEFIDDTVD